MTPELPQDVSILLTLKHGGEQRRQERRGGTRSEMVAANWILLSSATHWQDCKFSSDTWSRPFYRSDLESPDKPSASYSSHRLMFLPGSLLQGFLRTAVCICYVCYFALNSTWITAKTLISSKLAKMRRVHCLGTDNLVQKAFWDKMTGCMAKYYGSDRIKKHKIQSWEGFPVSSAQTAKHSVLLENTKISIFTNS